MTVVARVGPVALDRPLADFFAQAVTNREHDGAGRRLLQCTSASLVAAMPPGGAGPRLHVVDAAGPPRHSTTIMAAVQPGCRRTRTGRSAPSSPTRPAAPERRATVAVVDGHLVAAIGDVAGRPLRAATTLQTGAAGRGAGPRLQRRQPPARRPGGLRLQPVKGAGPPGRSSVVAGPATAVRAAGLAGSRGPVA